jgi:hypothetical protein
MGATAGMSPRFSDSVTGFLVGLLVVPAVVLAALPFLAVVVAIHEAGHLCAAFVVGGRCVEFHVLLWSWEKRDGRWRFRWVNDFVTGGHVRCISRSGGPQAGVPYLLGGPLFSLLAAGGFTIAASETAGVWPWVYGPLAFFSAIVGLGSLLPMRLPNGNLSDGSRLVFHLRLRGIYRTWADIVELHAATSHTRPRDYAAGSLNARNSAPAYLAYLHLCRYWAELDSGHIVAAAAELKSAWEGIGELEPFVAERAQLAFEVAMLFTRFVDDPELAATAYDCGTECDASCPTRLTADAARHFRMGEEAEARDKLEQLRRRYEAESSLPDYMKSYLDDSFALFLDPNIPVRTHDDVEAEVARGEYPRLCEPIGSI